MKMREEERERDLQNREEGKRGRGEEVEKD